MSQNTQKKSLKPFVSKAISNLVLLMFVILFVVVFKNAFGEQNILVGVITITALFMFMPYNLSVQPGKFFLKILIINLFMGIGAFITGFGPVPALIANFLVVYLTAYSYYNSFRMEMYFPFLLQYAFLLFNPIAINTPQTVHELIMRLLSLCVCPVLVIGVQMFMHRDYATKRIRNVSVLIDKLLDEINGISHDFGTTICNLKLSLFDYKEDRSSTSYKNNIILNVIETLENMYYHYANGKYKENDVVILTKYLLHLKDAINNNEDIVEFDINDIESINLKNNISLIDRNLRYINKKLTISENAKEFVQAHTLVKPLKTTGTIKRYAVEQAFSLKVAIAISLIVFIADQLHFPEGKWAVFTVISVMTPLFEKSSQKMKYRLGATVVGLVSLVVLFYFFKTPIERTILIMLANYIQMFQTQYKYKIIFVTFSAVGMVMLNVNVGQDIDVALIRLAMIICGLFIGIIFNRFVFSYRLKDSINYDKYRYTNCVNEIFGDLKLLVEEKYVDHKINSRILIPNLVNNTINKNITECEAVGKETNPITLECFENTNYLYHYYLCVKNKLISMDEVKKIIEKIDDLGRIDFSETQKLNKILKEQNI